MLKKIILALALTTFAATSAFAGAKVPQTPPAAHKVAQTGETKPVAAKIKRDKKVKKEAKVAPPAVTAPTAAAPATTAPAKK